LNVKYGSLLKKNMDKNWLTQKRKRENIPIETPENQIIQILEQSAGSDTADDYKKLLGTLDFAKIRPEHTALMIIDPQRSFTKGAWMKSIGSQAQQDIKAIELGFRHCAQLIRQYEHLIETMFSKCPFPPDSYEWDDHFKEIIDPKQLYFIKPGNSILFPPTNGYRQWVEQILDRGKSILVMGGCTLNSCVRVSAIETLTFFKSKNLRVIVDLSISGARIFNYRGSELFGGLSSVESAVREMVASGVEVVRGVDYDD
jgi:nicotinamidase-related amidase